MKLNLFGNFAGHGGYQVLSQEVIKSLRSYLKDGFLNSVNLHSLSPHSERDPYLKRCFVRSKNLMEPLADVSLGVVNTEQGLNFCGKKRIIYCMHEGSKLSPKDVRLLNNFDQVWTSSNFNKNVFAKSGVKEEKLKLLLGSVDSDLFCPLVKSKQHILTSRLIGSVPISPENPFTFLQVGKYENRKSSRLVVQAFLKTFEDHPLREVVQLRVKWSSTVYVRSIHQIKSELADLFLMYPKAAQRVSMVEGHDVDMTELYNSADCFLFPSKSEGIGLPLLEAMACGIPCITTGYGSLPDYYCKDANIVLPDRGVEPMQDNFYGLNEANNGTWGVVQLDDLENSMLDMVEMSEQKRYSLGKQGQKHIRKFSHYSTGKKIVNLIQELN